MTVTTQQIWTDFSEALKQLITRQVPNQADAEDILQDVFQKIHHSLHTLKADSKLQAWIYQITRNAIIDYYRQQKMVVKLSEALEEETDEVEVHSIMACLKPIVENLPEKYRQALVMTEFEGVSQKALAESLGISFSGVKSRVQRAREQVKAKLLACCHLEFDRMGQIVEYHLREPGCNNPERSC